MHTFTYGHMYIQPINTCQYLMEEMNVLPDLTILHLIVTANGHDFGASAFHVLKMCTGIRELVLELSLPSISEVKIIFVYLSNALSS